MPTAAAVSSCPVVLALPIVAVGPSVKLDAPLLRCPRPKIERGKSLGRCIGGLHGVGRASSEGPWQSSSTMCQLLRGGWGDEVGGGSGRGSAMIFSWYSTSVQAKPEIEVPEHPNRGAMVQHLELHFVPPRLTTSLTDIIR